MKKILSILALLALLFSFTSCSSSPHKHTYDAGTVAKEVTCEEAGAITYACTECTHVYTKTISAGHIWSDGDCTSAKTCERCNITSGEPLGHEYENNVCVKCNHELTINLTVPQASAQTPLVVYNNKGRDSQSTYEITNISYTVSGTTDDSVTVTITLEGIKTEDKAYHASRNVVGKIAYKIYDQDGFVIFSSTKDTMMLKEGDKFKNLKISLSGFNAEQKYTLEFFDYYS